MKNVILICALSAVAIMSIGLFLYDYIPSGLTVTKASQYETSSSTTEVLSDSKEAESLLTSQSTSTDSESGSTSSVQTNIVLREYTISKSDLAMYQSSGDLQQGRADPFAEVQAQPENGDGQSPNGNNSNTSSQEPFFDKGNRK